MLPTLTQRDYGRVRAALVGGIRNSFVDITECLTPPMWSVDPLIDLNDAPHNHTSAVVEVRSTPRAPRGPRDPSDVVVYESDDSSDSADHSDTVYTAHFDIDLFIEDIVHRTCVGVARAHMLSTILSSDDDAGTRVSALFKCLAQIHAEVAPDTDNACKRCRLSDPGHICALSAAQDVDVVDLKTEITRLSDAINSFHTPLRVTKVSKNLFKRKRKGTRKQNPVSATLTDILTDENGEDKKRKVDTSTSDTQLVIEEVPDKQVEKASPAAEEAVVGAPTPMSAELALAASVNALADNIRISESEKLHDENADLRRRVLILERQVTCLVTLLDANQDTTRLDKIEAHQEHAAAHVDAMGTHIGGQINEIDARVRAVGDRMGEEMRHVHAEIDSVKDVSNKALALGTGAAAAAANPWLILGGGADQVNQDEPVKRGVSPIDLTLSATKAAAPMGSVDTFENPYTEPLII